MLAGPQGDAIRRDFDIVIAALRNDQSLAAKHSDHALTGNWHHYRDCHIRPDLVLIYRKVGDDSLKLARIGSHSELGL